jgi:excinuclease UvrABC helicase subunit UvrB
LGAFLQKEQGAESHWAGSEAFTGIEVYEEISPETDRTRERKKNELESNINRLKREIADAVSREEYEKAAELKNKLGSLLCESDDEEDVD